MLVIRRISKILALLVVYSICAGEYLKNKGFVFTENGPVLTRPAYAQADAFSMKINGTVNISTDRLRIMGKADAPLTIYGYSSMTCSHCKDFHQYILPKIERDFIAEGKVRFVFVHFPIDQVAMRAAKISYCLPKEKYYDFISFLYDKRDWQFADTEELLTKYAKDFGLTQTEIDACKENAKLTSDILLTRNQAIEDFGIQGTPSFIVEGKDGGELIVGSRNYDDFKDYLNKRLGADEGDNAENSK